MWNKKPLLLMTIGFNLMISSRCGSLCESLQEQVVTTPGNAKSLWDHLKDLFHDNKDVRAINLDNELRSIKIGKRTVNDYCTKIKSMANRLKNLDCEVSEKNLVIYAVNGLDSLFDTLVEIIRHREPLLAFETVRNMLLLKESSLNDDSGSTTFESSSSSPTILMATSDNKGTSQLLMQLCNHFYKGTCRLRDRCKFIHDHQNRVGLNTNQRNNNPKNNRPTVPPSPNSWGSQSSLYTRNPPNLAHPRPIHYSSPTSSLPHPLAHQALYAAYPTPYPNISQQVPTLGHSHPGQAQPQPNVYGQYSPHYSNQGVLGAAPTLYTSQPTSLPSAFNTMSLQDPTWNMDTGFLDSPYPPMM